MSYANHSRSVSMEINPNLMSQGSVWSSSNLYKTSSFGQSEKNVILIFNCIIGNGNEKFNRTVTKN